jgi:hypothetical protein
MSVTGTPLINEGANYAITQICNLTATKLGSERITSLDDDSPIAKDLAFLYEQARDTEISLYNWVFAIKRTTLAADTTTPDEYTYQYSIPYDCLRILQVGDYYPSQSYGGIVDSEYLDYVIENGKILTDQGAPLTIKYIYRNEDATTYPSPFQTSLACKLAILCCEARTQSNTKKDMLWKEYQISIRDAIKVNAIQKVPKRLATSSLIRSRRV